MFNSTILDVAIGLIFVYLLLSLICTAANELIESWLRKRATDLERGVRELLDPGSKAADSVIVRQLYNHPLVNGLFKGRYETSGIISSGFFGRIWRFLKRTNLPSYIPSRNFALALMDIVLPGQASAGAGGRSGATGATSSPAAGAPVVTINVEPTPPGAPIVAVAPAAVPPAAPNPSLQALRNQIPTLGNPQVEQALTALIDAAGNDVAKARENIENWFNSSMDRVSGAFKRRSVFIVLGIAFVVTIAVNADTIAIAKKLSSDKALRESLVAAADAYAKANASVTPTPTPSPTPAETPKPAASLTPAPATALSSATPSQTPTASPTSNATSTPSSSPAETRAAASPSPSPTPTPTPCWHEACKDGKENSPQCKLKRNQCAIEGLGLPIGWDSPDDPKNKWPGFGFWKKSVRTGWTEQFGDHFPGWLLTALAISLGAPFWFDLLNKFIVVRSTVKPKEKSPDEKSKD